jgi:hypothetical protein
LTHPPVREDVAAAGAVRWDEDGKINLLN